MIITLCLLQSGTVNHRFRFLDEDNVLTRVLLYSETYRAESTDTVVVSPAKDKSPVTTTVSRQSYSAVRHISGDQGMPRLGDLAVKRKQIGLKRKSLQEMRHLLNTATIKVCTPVSLDDF